MIEMGLASHAKIEEMPAEMRRVNADESVVLLLLRQWQVWGHAGPGRSNESDANPRSARDVRSTEGGGHGTA